MATAQVSGKRRHGELNNKVQCANKIVRRGSNITVSIIESPHWDTYVTNT